jgi:hypothetical protein
MHRRTFDRAWARIYAAEEIVEAHYDLLLARLKRSLDRRGDSIRSGALLLAHGRRAVDDVWISACEPPPPRPFCKPLGPPAPLVAIPLEVVQGPTQLVVAGPDLAKELLNG